MIRNVQWQSKLSQENTNTTRTQRGCRIFRCMAVQLMRKKTRHVAARRAGSLGASLDSGLVDLIPKQRIRSAPRKGSATIREGPSPYSLALSCQRRYRLVATKKKENREGKKDIE